ncbi:unnamed protein product, partial [Iphiclides podalirius]
MIEPITSHDTSSATPELSGGAGRSEVGRGRGSGGGGGGAARACARAGHAPHRRRAALLSVGGARHRRQSTGDLRSTHTCPT